MHGHAVDTLELGHYASAMQDEEMEAAGAS